MVLVLVAIGVAGCQPNRGPGPFRLPLAGDGSGVDDGNCIATRAEEQLPESEPTGITIVPLAGAEDDARVIAGVLGQEIDTPIVVKEPASLRADACSPRTDQLVVEQMLHQFGDRGDGRRVTLVVAADDIRSSQFAWQFGAWDPRAKVGLISGARLDQYVPNGMRSHRRHRLAVLAQKYVLMMYFNAEPRSDPKSLHLLAPKYSFGQLDATKTGICRHHESVGLLQTSLACGAAPHPAHGTVEDAVRREAAASAARDASE
jgi:hypothetical protein